MIKSIDLLNKIKEVLGKDQILEQDLNSIENLTLNRYRFNGSKNDIDLNELKILKNLKTLTLIKFEIDKNVIETINHNNFLWAVQFSSCKFEDIIPINQQIKYLILDYCENVKFELINNNKSIKIIGSKVELTQLKQLNNTEELYLQDCQIKNTEGILIYNKLKLLNLDGSIIENNGILDKLNNNIKVYYKEEYHPLGGV